MTKKDKQEIDRRIYELEQVHPRRPRSAYYGELIHMDPLIMFGLVACVLIFMLPLIMPLAVLSVPSSMIKKP